MALLGSDTDWCLTPTRILGACGPGLVTACDGTRYGSAVETYSHRSASIGASRDALIAGYSPEPIPTSTVAPTASSTVPSEMPAYILAWVFARIAAVIPYAPVSPNSNPATLPITQIVTDSARNCSRM